MGQKTNPLCFRLGTTHSHHSVWFEEPKNYSTSIQEEKTFIRVIIYSGFVPKFLLKGKCLAKFKKNVKKQEFFSIYPRLIRIQLKRAEQLYSQPNLLAEFITLQLKNRVPFRKTMQQAIDLAKETGKRKGKLPLQIICAKIDYCSHTIQTINGVLGLKIWIFRK
ncbi:hypothetical protein HU200_014416 [Digitaria exilis]|uniref:Ribosomal protein S3 n=1 Tax=Digitaria exilis TaxID=1010633 RepID=A0A835FBX0_9POAL|nr:hypothetical protein HU200_014416 [Digitaria exilis]